MSHRVLGEIFVGREKELARFKELLLPSCRTHILSVHTNGEGGIGKTQLLLQMQKICKERPDDVLYTKKLIDFYHTEARIKIGVIHMITEEIGEDNFPGFKEKLNDYNETDDRDRRRTLAIELENAFIKEYADFSKKNNKIIILFFDTYEVIQGNECSRWLETYLFRNLSGNTRIIVAGRRPLGMVPAEPMEIKPFDVSDTINYWKECFNVNTESDLENQIGSREVIEKIHGLAKGHPVLLALFADWLQYEDNPLLPTEMIDTIRVRIEKEPGKSEEELFEASLVERIGSLKNPEDRVITYLAFAYRRMTLEMFSFIADVSLEHSKSLLLEKLKPLSFIKYKEDQQTVLLHDEMRDLVVRHWWEKQDAARHIRKDIAVKLVEYYDKLLEKADPSEMEEAILYAERLYYQLYADINTGFKSFILKFDRYFQEYRIHFCDLLGGEIVEDLFFKELPLEKQLDLIIRRIRWRNEQYRSSEALAFFQNMDTESDIKYLKRDRDILTKFFQKIDTAESEGKTIQQEDKLLSAHFNHERGVAYFWLNKFDEAIRDFSKAEKAFRKTGDRYRLAWELNWLGYTKYRNSDFKEAQKVLDKSIKEFLKARQDIPEDAHTGISNAYSNLNPVLRLQGRFYEAAIYGEIAAAIAEKKQNDREWARFLNALGDTYKLANKTFEASKAFEKALGILESTPDPLLRARVLTGMALLSYRHSDHIYILEYYQREKDREEALARFREAYPSAKEQFEEARDTLEEAKNILENTISQSTTELADVYFYLGEYHTITNEREKALEFFIKSEKIAKKVSNEYRKIDAIVGQIIVYYLEGKKVEDKEIQDCAERAKESVYVYNNLSGKMEIIFGNFAYERYLEEKDNEDLREAVRRYVVACDYMYAFSRVSRDRFYATFRILLKRMGDLPVELLPSAETIESLGDIWDYDEYERNVCQLYSDKFDEIIDFTLKRYQFHRDTAEIEAYVEDRKERIRRCINYGKEELRFAPIYAEMLFQSQRTSELPIDLAEAYFYLAKAYDVNDNIFEARKNIVLAFERVKETDDDYLQARILIRLGKILYRREEYAKSLEHHRKENFGDKINKQDTDKAFEYFKEAERILDQLGSDAKNEAELKSVAYVQAHLEFRLAECLSVTGGDGKEIEKRFHRAIEKAEFSDNVWRQGDAIQSLITYYYFSDQWDNRKPEIEELRKKFTALNDKQYYYPALKGRLAITDGNVKYDQISSRPGDEFLIEEAFNHYIVATRYKAEYSDKHFYEAVGTLLDRVAGLPKESVKILYKKVYPRLHHKRPTGAIAHDAYKLIEQCIYIHSEVL
ncbi:tetratricopeptide repeat protein [Desulfobacterales bacterium HSG2]|nr:tetratricopeptide repeat protein [Desulfobacterales bacterium HSG2]